MEQLVNILCCCCCCCCSDIVIARSQTPKDISLLAKEIGLMGSEVSMYGNKKAKIALGALKRLEPRGEGSYVVVAG